MDLDEKIARGNEANQILNSHVFRDSMSKMRQEIVDKWAACPARDKEAREWLWNHYQVALKFEEILVEVMNTGKMALQEKELSLAEKVKGFARRFA